MNSDQKKSIQKTVLIIVAIMSTILVLFLNKITTPRYLSNIELKINGLILQKNTERAEIQENLIKDRWVLLVSDAEEKEFLDNVFPLLKTSLKEKVVVLNEAEAQLSYTPSTDKAIIPLIKPDGEYFAYFKGPFDANKMILTLSSAVTHR